MSDLLDKAKIEEQTNGQQLNNAGIEREFLPNLCALENEENSLLEEKRVLLDMKEQLHKMRDEVDARRRRVEALRDEVSALKCECEEIANALNIPVVK